MELVEIVKLESEIIDEMAIELLKHMSPGEMEACEFVQKMKVVAMELGSMGLLENHSI